MTPDQVHADAHIIYLFVPYSPILTLSLVTIGAIVLFRVVLRIIDILNVVT